MALRKQNVDLPLAIGLDTKTTPKQTKGLLRMENAFIRKTGELIKRGGKKFIADDVFSRFRDGGEEMVEGFELHNHKDRALVLTGRDSEGTSPGGFPFTDAMEGQGIFSQTKAKAGWDVSSNRSRIGFDIERVTSRDVDDADVAIGSGYEFVVYREAGSARVLYSIIEQSTGTKIFSDHELREGVEPKVVHVKKVIGSASVFIVWLREKTGVVFGDLVAFSWDPATPNIPIDIVADKIITITGTTNAGNEYDVVLQDAGTMVVPHTDGIAPGADDLRVRRIDADGTVLSNTLITIGSEGVGGIGAWIAVSGATTTIFVAFIGTAPGPVTGINTVVLSASGTLLSGPTSVSIFGASYCNGIQATAFSELVDTLSTEPASVLVASARAGGPLPASAQFILLDSTGAAVSSATPLTLKITRSIAKPYVVDGIPYFPLLFTSTLQPSIFIVSIRQNGDNTIAATVQPFAVNTDAKVLAGRAGGILSSVFSGTVDVGSGKFIFATTRQDRTIADGAIVDGVVLVEIDMRPDKVGCVNVGLNTQLVGGVITDYDGVAQELGFHYFPETILEESRATSGGFIIQGIYAYRAVYEWTDRSGQFHRSAPSSAVTVNNLGDAPLTTTNIIEIRVPTLTFTERGRPVSDGSADVSERAKGSNIEVHLYRTEAGPGSAFHKTGAFVLNTPSQGPNAPDPSDAFVLITDTIVDADLIKNERLYTDGGELENIGPTASKAVASRRDRVFLVPSDDPSAIFFSKPKVEGRGIEFNDASFIRLERGGGFSAVAVLDDNIIGFKEDTIYAFGGEGPNANGEGAFTAPRKISSDIGCIEQRSIVETDVGIFFKSKKGISLINRSLVTSYIGAPVEDFNDDTIVSSVLLPELHQVRFALANSRPVLVFDYYHQKWSTYEFGDVADAVNFNGDYVMISSTGKVFQEDLTKFTDDVGDGTTTKFGFKIETPWLSFAGVQGYQRIWWVYLLGEFKTGHTLRIGTYCDYVETERESVQTVINKDPEPYQFRFKPAFQKCEAIRFTIEDLPDLGNEESMSLDSLSLTVGVKRSLKKVDDFKTI